LNKRKSLPPDKTPEVFNVINMKTVLEKKMEIVQPLSHRDFWDRAGRLTVGTQVNRFHPDRSGLFMFPEKRLARGLSPAAACRTGRQTWENSLIKCRNRENG